MDVIVGLLGAGAFFAICYALICVAMEIDGWVANLGNEIFDGRGYRPERFWPFVGYLLLCALALIFFVIKGLIAIWVVYEGATAARDWWHDGNRR
ncbi:MAG: hypothetical protein ACOYNZ_17410 [Rhodoferax sp.]